MSTDPQDVYGDPEIYDILTSPGTDREVDGLLRMAATTQPDDRPWRWLEPACGTGRYLRYVHGHGIEVWGFDASDRMIRYSAEYLPPSAHLWVADYGDFGRDLPPASIDFAFNLDNSFRHLESDDAAVRHLTEMAKCLRKDGLYAVGIDMLGDRDPITEDIWTSERGDCRVTQVMQFLPPDEDRFETILGHQIIERPTGTEHRDHVYRLRTYRSEQWHDLLAMAGWEIADVVNERGQSMADGAFAYGVYLLRSSTRDGG